MVKATVVACSIVQESIEVSTITKDWTGLQSFKNTF